ncbi:hypothetical protein F5Y12DRAFT_794338 [Xylaria sp. FL1777]|nr:hypothetical protein F5Y12DRAFT_794338 [Xylaria sp. FL1777]
MDHGFIHKQTGITKKRRRPSDYNQEPCVEIPKNHQFNIRKPSQEEDELEKRKRESEVRVTAEFLEKFIKENHAGRVPPDPSILPAEFLCIHYIETPFIEHEGVLRNPGKMIMRAPRFSAGEYEIVDNDDGDGDGSAGVLKWSCCDREEDEAPRQDWYNVRFSRGDPKLREGVREPPKPDCAPTFHEP